MNKHKIFSLILVLLSTTLYAQKGLDSIIKLDTDGFREILVQINDVFISGQPEKIGINKLKQLGVTTIINLRTDREMNDRSIVSYDEASYVDSIGLKYVHIPLGGPNNPYTPKALVTFHDALHNSQGKVLLHCTVAWRASHLWTAYLIKYKGIEPEKAIEHGRKINLGSLPLESFLNRKITLKEH